MRLLSAFKQLNRTNAEQIGYWWSSIVFLIFLLIYYLVSLGTHCFTTPLRISQEINNPNRFIAERAYEQLRQLTNIRNEEYSNDQQIVQFIINEIDKIIIERNPIQFIEYDIQNVSGIFSLDLKTSNILSAYNQINNIIVKVSPFDAESEFSLLINTHFNGFPNGSSAGENGVMISVMLEALRILSKLSVKLPHSIIFLFNGAGGLQYSQGTHGFITQHRWSGRIRALINLYSLGTDGRDLLFDATDNASWLIEYYRNNAKHYFGSVLIEDLIQTFITDYGTDFHVFQDNSNVPGIDMRLINNGYVHRTKYDRFELIEQSTLQNTGDNLYGMIQVLGIADELRTSLDNNADDSVITYFDFLGIIFIIYNKTNAILINLLISTLSIIAIVLSANRMARRSDLSYTQLAIEFGRIALIQLISIIFGMGITLILAVIFDASNRSMSWFTETWLILGLYYCPFYFCLAIGPALYITLLKQEMSLQYTVQSFLHVQCIFYIIVVLLMTSLRIRLTFLLMFTIVFYTLTTYINLFLHTMDNIKIWPVIHLLGQIIPFIFHSYQSTLVYSMLIPIQGRNGPNPNPDIVITIISSCLAILLGSFIIPIYLLCRRTKLILCGFLVIFFIFLMVIISPIGFPYSASRTPQRYWIFHTNSISHNHDESIRIEKNGYLLVPMDRHSLDFTAIQDLVPEMVLAERADNDCKSMLLCGLPFYSSRQLEDFQYSYWIPTMRSNILEKSVIYQMHSTQLNETTTRHTFFIRGPSHMALSISPEPGVEIVQFLMNDTIEDDILESVIKWDNRIVYFINMVNALDNLSFKFEVDLSKDVKHLGFNFELALIGHYSSHTNHTGTFIQFMETFPDWAHITSWTSSYESWIF